MQYKKKPSIGKITENQISINQLVLAPFTEMAPELPNAVTLEPATCRRSKINLGGQRYIVAVSTQNNPPVDIDIQDRVPLKRIVKDCAENDDKTLEVLPKSFFRWKLQQHTRHLEIILERELCNLNLKQEEAKVCHKKIIGWRHW